MNASVKSFMDQLFAGAPDTEDIRALREEITNNCEEHFQDLTAQGLSEEEAAAEILSSLRGMEDVVSEMSRNASGPETAAVPEGAEPLADPAASAGEAAGEPGESAGRLVLSAAGLKKLVIQAGSEDLELSSSPDAMIHVLWNPESCVEVLPRTEGEVLSLSLQRSLKTAENPENAKQFFTINNEEGSFSINFRDLTRKVKSLLQTSFQALESSTVRILIPAAALDELDISDRSGDIHADGCGFRSARIRSVSGDIFYRDTVVLTNLDCGSTSGDLSVDAFTESLVLSTLSGDVDIQGGAVSADIKSTSGDVDMEGGLARGGAVTVSGDIDIALHSRLNVENLSLRTTSGDVELDMGESGPAHYVLSSVSGDISRAPEDVPGGALIQIKTISGDITVR